MLGMELPLLMIKVDVFYGKKCHHCNVQSSTDAIFQQLWLDGNFYIKIIIYGGKRLLLQVIYVHAKSLA